MTTTTTTATTTTATAASVPERRVRPIDGIRQSLTLAWRTLAEARHQPYILADYSIQAIAFILLFTFVFGGAIVGDWREYLSFMLPGMLAINMLFYAMYVGQGLNRDLTSGVFDRLRSLPITRWAPLVGRIVADQLKQVWAILLVLGFGMLLGFRLGTGIVGLLGAIVLLLVFALAFSWVAVIAGIVAKDPERVQLYSMNGLFPVVFVSNVFVPVETLPGWLQPVADGNPVSVLTDAVRGLMVTGFDPVATGQSLAWAAGIAAVFAPLAARAYRGLSR
jgi:oleandomycin transport system permease protein